MPGLLLTGWTVSNAKVGSSTDRMDCLYSAKAGSLLKSGLLLTDFQFCVGFATDIFD